MRDAVRSLFVLSLFGALGAACADQPFTIDVPLRVVSIAPAAGAVGVARAANIEVVFSESIESGSATAETLRLERIDGGGASAVPAAVSYDAARFAAVIDPQSLLAYTGTYRLTVTTGILRERDQGPLPIQVTAEFRTENPPPLRLLSSAPGDGASGVRRETLSATATPLVFTFSEGLRRPTNDQTLLGNQVVVADVTGFTDPYNLANTRGAIAGAITFNAANGTNDLTTGAGNDNIMTFTPSAVLDYATVVRVVLRGQPPPSLNGLLSDRATTGGGQLLADEVIVFEIERPLPLLVLYTVPSDQSRINPTNTPVTVVFSEGLDCTTVIAGTSFDVNFDATDPVAPGSDVAGNFQPACSAGADTMTFVPAPQLGYSRDVTVTLTTGLAAATFQELNPNADQTLAHLLGPVVFSFSTLDPPDLFVLTTRPGPNSTGIAIDAVVEAVFSEGLDVLPAPTPTNFRIFDLTADPSRTNNLCAAVSVSTTTAAGDTLGCAHPNFIQSHVIEVRLTGLQSALATLRGGQLVPDPVVYQFTILDLPPLLVLSGIPSDGQTAVDIGQPIVVRFDRGVDPATATSAGNFMFEQLTGFGGTVLGTVAGGRALSSSVFVNDTVTLTPASLLAYDAFYRYTLTTSVCIPKLVSQTGGCLTRNYVSEFEVRSREELRVVATDPTDGATGIPIAGPSAAIGRELLVVFSEAISVASLNGTDPTPGGRSIYVIKGDTITPTRSIPLAYLAAICPGASCPCSATDTVSGYFCVSLEGATVKLFPDPTTDTVDPGGPAGDIDWRKNQPYNIYITTAVQDAAGLTNLPDPSIRRFVTLVSGLIQSAVLTPSGSILGNFVLTFTAPLDPFLTNGTTAADASAFHVDFVDGFGNTVPLPVQICFEQTGVSTCSGTTNACALTDGTSTCTGVRIQPQLDTADCADGSRRLLYDTFYRVHASAALRSDNLSLTNAGFAPITLKTSGAPNVVAAVAQNTMVTCNLANETCDKEQNSEGPRVPINAGFVITFDQDMAATSFVASAAPPASPAANTNDTVLLTNITAGCSVAVLTAYDAAGRTLTVSTNPAGGGTCPFGVTENAACNASVPAADLPSLQFDQEYVLTVRGRSLANPPPTADPCPSAGSFLEVCTTDGRYLDANTAYGFQTSSANTVMLRPNGVEAVIQCNALVTATFSREVDLSTAGRSSFVVQVATPPGPPPALTVAKDGLYTKSADSPDVLTFIPTPATCGNVNQAIQSTIMPAVRDLLGNPFPTDRCTNYVVTNNPASTCPQPDSYAPAGGATLLGGHHRLSLCWVGSPKDMVLEPSLTPRSLKVEDFAAASAIPVEYSIAPPSTDLEGDRVVMTPKSYFRAGRQYRVSLLEFAVSSQYNQPWEQAACGFTGNIIDVFGDTTRPAVVSVTTDAAPASALTSIGVTFSDAIDPRSIVDGAGNSTGFLEVRGPAPLVVAVGGTYRFENSGGATALNSLAACGSQAAKTVSNPVAFDRAIFVPAQPLATGTYTVALRDVSDTGVAECGLFTTVSPRAVAAVPTAIWDAAGNCLQCAAVDCDTTFTVEAVAPTVTAAVPGPGATESSSIVLTFSEPMDVTLPAPAIVETTYTASIPACGGLQIDGCLSFRTAAGAACADGLSCRQAVLAPVAPFLLPEQQALGVTVDLVAAQVTDLAGNPVDKAGSTPVIPYTFTTADYGPQVLCGTPVHEPACDGTTFLATANISITLDQNVTNLASAARLEDTTAGTLVPFTVSGPGPTYTIDPTPVLTVGNCYELRIDTALTDGTNTMSREFYLRFKAN